MGPDSRTLTLWVTREGDWTGKTFSQCRIRLVYSSIEDPLKLFYPGHWLRQFPKGFLEVLLGSCLGGILRDFFLEKHFELYEIPSRRLDFVKIIG